MKTSSPDTLGASILIVDDQVSNVQLLQELLGAEGYTNISTTMDSRQACDMHREHNFDLILLDLQMPHMDGFEVMKCLNAIETGAGHHRSARPQIACAGLGRQRLHLQAI